MIPAPISIINPSRDSWCTPGWLTELLPVCSLDPCGNPRSTVRAYKTYSLENGEDGLSLPWVGDLFFLNPPFSDIMPWIAKAGSVFPGSFGFLVNVDPSTSWWKRMQERWRLALFFHKRIQFVAPPGVVASTNSKPQALVMDEHFWARCDARLSEYGTMWRRV